MLPASSIKKWRVTVVFNLESRSRGGVYGRHNPPPKLDIAQRRLQTVNTELGDIEAQLTHTNPSLYPDMTRFNDWKRRATKIVGSYKAEKAFLEDWIADAKSKNLPKNVLETRKNAAIAALSTLIDEQVRGFNKRYQVRYGQHVPDPNAEEASKRYEEVLHLWNECSAVLLEIKRRSEAARVSNKQMEQLRKPLGNICSRMQTEIAFLKNLSPNLRQRFDKIGFLLKVLDRAKAGGFLLIEEETTILQTILEDRAAAFKRMGVRSQ